MALFANFDETGKCVAVGEGCVDAQLPEQFTGTFAPRYRLEEGQVIDLFSGLTDEQAEQQWLASLPPPAVVEETVSETEGE
jgi:hypothetical protein